MHAKFDFLEFIAPTVIMLIFIGMMLVAGPKWIWRKLFGGSQVDKT